MRNTLNLDKYRNLIEKWNREGFSLSSISLMITIYTGKYCAYDSLRNYAKQNGIEQLNKRKQATKQELVARVEKELEDEKTDE